MRFLIAGLFIAALVTGFVAYGPKFGPVDKIIEAAIPPPEAPVEVIEEIAKPEPEPILPDSVPMGEIIPGTDGLRRVEGRIQRSINHTMASILERNVADPLTQVVSRILVWWINPGRDMQPGDRLVAVYSLHEGEEPRLHALSLLSHRHGRTYRAYAFHPEGYVYRRFYTEDGKEVERRLEGSPIREYEQITSLLWDGRNHNGVDFKTPVGTEVFAPFDGRVARLNWNTRFNGNCIQIDIENGRRIIFLHMDSFAEDMKPGRNVRKGELVGLSGNTGRSTAPHLHYEIQTSSGRILDPFDVHPNYRLEVPQDQREAFTEHVKWLHSILKPEESQPEEG